MPSQFIARTKMFQYKSFYAIACMCEQTRSHMFINSHVNLHVCVFSFLFAFLSWLKGVALKGKVMVKKL